MKHRELCLLLRLNIHMRRQFAYEPSHTPQGQPSASKPQQGTSYQQQQPRAMMPPPPPIREKARGAFPSGTGGVFSHARGQLPLGEGNQAQLRIQPDATFGTTAAHRVVPAASKRFTPRTSTSHTPSGLNSRIVPQTPVSRRFVPNATTAGPRVYSRAGNPAPTIHDGQRTPFFPGKRMG